MLNFLKAKLAILSLLLLCMACNRDESSPKNPPPEHKDAPSHYNELKNLDWLVGNWADDEPDIDLNISYKWDRNKNFLIQEFVLITEDRGELRGRQIIGWDPSQKKIRSWIFDSDGNFGEGVWTIDNNNIYANMIFTLDDGSKGSVTHIYTKVNDNTYTFSSENKDINGELMPDEGPFKVVRR